MTQTELPEKITRVVQAIRDELGAEVDVERVQNLDPFPDRFRLAVVSKQFESVPHLERQDRLWEIVDRVLDRGESLAISMILAFSPNELEPAATQKK